MLCVSRRCPRDHRQRDGFRKGLRTCRPRRTCGNPPRPERLARGRHWRLHKPVPHPGFGNQVHRTCWIGLELASQLSHEDAEVVRLRLISRLPNGQEQLLLADEAAGIAYGTTSDAEVAALLPSQAPVVNAHALQGVQRSLTPNVSLTRPRCFAAPELSGLGWAGEQERRPAGIQRSQLRPS